MKLLLIHSDYIEYEARDSTPVAESEDDVALAGGAEEALVVFTAVESSDSEDLDDVVASAVAEVVDVAGELGVEAVVVYPYAHLSEDLSDPDVAVEALRGMADALEDEGYSVSRAPFGWYKRFELSCKGHPMSELSRSIEPIEVDGEDEERERPPSTYHVLTTEGSRFDAGEYEGSRELEMLVDDEIGEGGGDGREPAHIDLMRDKEFVGYDGLSDPGNLRWYPRGKRVRDLLIDYVDELVVDYGGMPVETPIMYDLGASCIHEHSDKFGERQYRFESGSKQLMLRFAACFGQFSIMRDMHISDADLPLRIYEMSTYSFRREQRGELSGLRRLRAFTMPDMHTACRDLEQAKDEFARQAELALDSADDFEIEYAAVLRVTEEFAERHGDWMEEFVADIDRDVLVEVLPERLHYWSAKIDLAYVASDGTVMENPTVQIDVESAERFDVEYHDDEGTHEPVVLHYSPTGSIERAFAALLEDAAESDVPSLPVWLAPTQARFVPVGDEHVDHCLEVASKLESAGVRVDVDDRGESVGARIRRAEQDWVPYVAVVGDDEVGGDALGVRVRERDEEVEMTVDELVDRVDEASRGLPRGERYTPVLLSEKPNFV